MSGFDNNKHHAPPAGDASGDIRQPSEIPWSEVELYVRRAKAMRSAVVADWVKRTVRSWASVFRRPGYMLPRPNSRWRPSTQ